jgi:manganese oxidase
MKALLALALLCLAVAGCSGAPSGPATPTQDAQGHYVIHMTSANQFSPRDAKVPVGANVTWVHDGGAQHNVVDKAGAFTSETLGTGQSYAHKFDAAGTYHYHCAFHSGMEATLTVA